MSLLPAENNLADLREVANKILPATTDENLKRLILVVDLLAYRCDSLERQVELLDRANAPR